ncbi:hypothetical protein HYFRA_00000840 [Hymenoscyphus fraxineus]|uniref:Myb-like DNA-binding domain-containing protein n=1 Tax=Hymenoscyphus fraxineus TaxID=746836 RepID=A0A9N9PS29_9HELO|nr:hypothetical protein HYFRA_00000840 [Hymenoscyphus fraxineus]
MSDSKDTKSDAAGMNPKDVEFLIACLQNANGGNVTIDSTGVAKDLGYDNPRSVQNRISTLKKKYNLPFGTSKGGSAAGTAASPAKVVKAKAPAKKESVTKKEPAAKKGSATKKPAAKGKAKKKVVESEEEAEAEVEADADADEEMKDPEEEED